MESQYIINKYTFSDGSTVALEDRITPLNEVEEGQQYLSCMVNIQDNGDGTFKGDACFVRVEFSHPQYWEEYRNLLNEMMSEVMGQETRCALIDVVQTSDTAVTVKHTDGTVGVLPINKVLHQGSHTLH